MQIVIDIPEKTYNMINAGLYDYGDMNVIIQNGTPLPKGHGRLIDADKIATHLEEMRDRWNYYCDEYEEGRCQSYYNALDEVADAPTLIEADTESEEA